MTRNKESQGKERQKRKKERRKNGPHVTFCSIILRQLHEILNSAITGKKKKIALNKHAIMDYVIAINTRSAINWCKFIAVVTLFHEIQNWTQRYDCPIALTANYYENWARYSLLLLIAITERRKKKILALRIYMDQSYLQ